MKNLLKYIQNINKIEHMWSTGDKVIACVSGGSDSMCLLNILNSLKNKKYIKSIVVAHVNYGMRGLDSDRDEAVVRKFSKEMGFQCEVLSVSKNDIGKNENDWRNIRYAFFEKVAKKHKANLIALAHNKNDQAETFLLNLLRGSGLEGLSCMSFKNNKTIRPLLGITKKEIIEYCKKNEIEYFEDYTNKDTSFRRNKIRIELIPYLEKKYNKKIVDTLSKTAFILADNYNDLYSDNESIWNYYDNSADCDKSKFLNLSTAKQREQLRYVIQNLTGNKYKKSFNSIEEYRKTILSNKNKSKVILNNGLKFEQKSGKVKFVLV